MVLLDFTVRKDFVICLYICGYVMPRMLVKREVTYRQGMRHGELLVRAQHLLEEERKRKEQCEIFNRGDSIAIQLKSLQ